jgi:hypothetical protein
MTKFFGISRQITLTLGISFGLGAIADAHTGMVDGYGCHRAPDKVSYHCHNGEFAGRTFKSKEEFLRQLRSGKMEQSPLKFTPPPLEKKLKD